MGVSDKGGVYPHLDPPRRVFADGEQFERIAELFAVGDIRLIHGRDPLPEYLGVRHFRMKGERGENGEFIHRVDPLHVVGGVGLRIAELLRLFERRAVIFVLLRHFGEDKIRGTVDDAHHLGNTVALHAVEESANDGHAAHTARLEIQTAAVAARRAFQLVRVFADELLIGSDDGLALVKRGEDVILRGFHAPDALDYDVHVGIGDDLRDIARDVLFGNPHFKRALFVADQDALHDDIHVLRPLIKLTMLGEDLVSSAAHDAESQNRHAYSFHHTLCASSNLVAFANY